MKKVKQNKVAVRFNISSEANNKIEITQGLKRSEGKKMTKEETLEYILLKFKE